jgi:K+-transporting ATPase ATPase C chain
MMALVRPALALVGLLTTLLGLAVPLAFTGIAQLVMPAPAGGSLVFAGGSLVGSALIGQDFVQDRYFHSRPSATTAGDPNRPGSVRDVPYNATGSGASNLAPSSAHLLAGVRERVATLGPAQVPADAATASASGLDPHIGPDNAMRQAARVAAARNMPRERVERLVQEQTEGPELGLLGMPRLNVLRLNLALDGMH